MSKNFLLRNKMQQVMPETSVATCEIMEPHQFLRIIKILESQQPQELKKTLVQNRIYSFFSAFSYFKTFRKLLQ